MSPGKPRPQGPLYNQELSIPNIPILAFRLKSQGDSSVVGRKKKVLNKFLLSFPIENALSNLSKAFCGS